MDHKPSMRKEVAMDEYLTESELNIHTMNVLLISREVLPTTFNLGSYSTRINDRITLLELT